MTNDNDKQRISTLETQLKSALAKLAQVRNADANKARIIADMRAAQVDGVQLKTVESGHGNSAVYRRDTTLADFYCSVCFFQARQVTCKPEDGALRGYCPNCYKQQTWLRGIAKYSAAQTKNTV
jgi:hypothetical protein